VKFIGLGKAQLGISHTWSWIAKLRSEARRAVAVWWAKRNFRESALLDCAWFIDYRAIARRCNCRSQNNPL